MRTTVQIRAAFALFCCAAASLRADLEIETILTAGADEQATAEFGTAVAIDASTVVVGAPHEDISASIQGAGAVYVFDGAGNFQTKLSDPSVDELDAFGGAAAVRGGIVVVGASRDEGGNGAGSAFVYDLSSGTSAIQVTPSDGAPGDRFGLSVDTDGVRVVVGAPENAVNSISDVGAIYIFDAASGAQLDLVQGAPIGGSAGDRFGESVAIDGDFVLAGAPIDSPIAFAQGSAFLIGPSSSQRLNAPAPDANTNDRFGESVAFRNIVAVVGAPGDDEAAPEAGAAYVFNASTGALVHKLMPPNPIGGESFGASVATDGVRVIVGAPASTEAAHVFDATDGTLITTLTASDGEPGDDLGNAVGIAPSGAIVGARAYDIGTTGNHGGAYLFTDAPCEGDANGDGAVDVSDISFVIFRLGDSGNPGIPGDANSDGVVDVSDISFVIFRLGNPCP